MIEGGSQPVIFSSVLMLNPSTTLRSEKLNQLNMRMYMPTNTASTAGPHACEHPSPYSLAISLCVVVSTTGAIISTKKTRTFTLSKKLVDVRWRLRRKKLSLSAA